MCAHQMKFTQNIWKQPSEVSQNSDFKSKDKHTQYENVLWQTRKLKDK